MEAARLFAHCYLDEDVHVTVAEIMRGHGYVVTTARDEEMLGASDSEQLAFAVSRERVLVTHNRVDFENLAYRYFEEGWPHWGIICAMRRAPRPLARRLISLLENRTADEFKNQLLYI